MALPIFLPCAAGVEVLLAEEAARVLKGADIRSQRGGVALQGGPDEVMALNLELRLAQRVLIEVAEGEYRDEADLYELARSVDWTQWITVEHTLRVDTTAQHSPLRERRAAPSSLAPHGGRTAQSGGLGAIKSLNFAALRIKDGVCDVMRDATGARPSVDVRAPDLPLLLHLGPERASLYIDTSGEPLFKRGWRDDVGDAPLKETLAAAMLAAAGWRGTPEAGGALHDPCCGSGTIAIEAAQIACDIAPGLKRRFAFERLLPFATPEMRGQWQRLKSHAQSRIHASAVPIHASDVSFRMVDFARRNAQRAGVEAAITFNGGDALERPAPALPDGLPGTLMVNPPYGERIDVAGKAAPAPRDSATTSDGDNRALSDGFFSRLSSHWKRAYTQHPAGWTAHVLSPDMKLPGAMRLKAARRVPMWNGPIECRLFRFDLVAGSMRVG